MGIFSDICEQCGNRVPKQARFCNKCGSAAPNGWTKCPYCNKWVGVESEFCHSCKAILFPKDRELVYNGTIRRQSGIFLQRVDIASVKRLLGKELLIEHGTKAIFMEDGKVMEILEPGVYKIEEGFFENLFSGKKAKTFFIVDSGDVVLPFNILGLHSKEGMKLNFYTESIFRFSPENATGLIENVLKGRRYITHNEPSEDVNSSSREVGYNTIWKCMELEVADAARSMCLETSVDDLIKDPDIRIAFENRLADNVERAAERYGLQFVRCAAVSFFGKDYDELRKRSSEIEADARRAVLEKRARRIVSDDRVDAFKSEKELQAQLDQLAFEYDISKEKMHTEFKTILLDLRHELDLKRQKKAQEIKKNADLFRRYEESLELEHKINQTRKKWEFARSEGQKNFEQIRFQTMAAHEDKIKKAENGLKLRARRAEQNTDHETKKSR